MVIRNGLYGFGKKNKENKEGKQYNFNQTDDFGDYVVVKFDKDITKLGLHVKG